MRADERLTELATTLEKRGGDKLRLQVVQRARVFKRSWIEMAEALIHVRKSKAYKAWGYNDLYEYCALELHIKEGTVDKLTGSYQTIKQHAPDVFRRDGVAQPVPPLESVDYFSRAISAKDDKDEADIAEDVVSALKEAVFDDGKSVAVLKRKFNPILFPKPESVAAIDALTKTRAAVRRLEGLLPNAGGMKKARRTEALTMLSTLREELDTLIEKERKRADRETAKSEADAVVA